MMLISLTVNGGGALPIFLFLVLQALNNVNILSHGGVTLARSPIASRAAPALK
jgi:hypothetical protein